MLNKIKNYGFVIPEILPEDFVLGGSKLPITVLRNDGQWPELLVPHEQQNLFAVETTNCVGFASSTIWEMLIKYQYNDERNFSDRALGIMAGTRPPGNTPNKVAYTAHKWGLIPEALLPFSDTITSASEYFSPSPLPQPILDAATYFLTQYELGYEWVFAGGSMQEKHEKMMEALRYSALGLAVFAWHEENGMYIQDAMANHWCVAIGYVKNQYWLIKDSYPPFIKKVPWNSDFAFSMRYSAIRISPPPPKKWYCYLGSYFKEIMK